MTESMIVAFVTALGSVVAAYFSYRAQATSRLTHVAVNSRMTELLKLTRESSKAEGVLQEKAVKKR